MSTIRDQNDSVLVTRLRRPSSPTGVKYIADGTGRYIFCRRQSLIDGLLSGAKLTLSVGQKAHTNDRYWPVAAITQNNNHVHWQLINSPSPSIRRICAVFPSPTPYPKRPVPTSPPPPALL